MDELPIPRINARMVSGSGADSKSNDVAGPQVFFPYGTAHTGLFFSRAGQGNTVFAIHPAYISGTIESGLGRITTTAISNSLQFFRRVDYGLVNLRDRTLLIVRPIHMRR